MKNSFQIKLNRYFFTKIFVSANPAHNPKGNSQGSQVLNHLTVGKPEDKSPSYFGELKLSVPLDKGENPPYEIDIGVFGVVDIIGEGPEEEKIHAAQLVLMQTLYGATREMVQLLTSRGPWASGFLLPLQIIPPPEVKKAAKAKESPKANKLTKEPSKKARTR